jgi:tetratricopeptide (TPR) repeat protein
MAAGTRDIATFEAEYLTGRNPLAYIPLCQALRRERRFAEALEHCQRGLEKTPDSAAGRTLLVRLLTDMGRHEPALREAERAERLAPASKGLLVAKARALGNLGKMDQATEILSQLEREHLLDPEVQILSRDLKSMEVVRPREQTRLPPEAQEPRRPVRFVSLEDLVAN